MLNQGIMDLSYSLKRRKYGSILFRSGKAGRALCRFSENLEPDHVSNGLLKAHSTSKPEAELMVILCYMSKQYTVTGGRHAPSINPTFIMIWFRGREGSVPICPIFLKQTEGNHDE